MTTTTSRKASKPAAAVPTTKPGRGKRKAVDETEFAPIPSIQGNTRPSLKKTKITTATTVKEPTKPTKKPKAAAKKGKTVTTVVPDIEQPTTAEGKTSSNNDNSETSSGNTVVNKITQNDNEKLDIAKSVYWVPLDVSTLSVNLKLQGGASKSKSEKLVEWPCEVLRRSEEKGITVELFGSVKANGVQYVLYYLFFNSQRFPLGYLLYFVINL